MRQFFLIHGVRLEIESPAGPLAEAAGEAFAGFTAPAGPADLRWRLGLGRLPAPSPDEAPLFTYDALHGYDRGEAVEICHGGSVLRLPREGRVASGVVAPETLAIPRFFSHVYLPLATQELLRRRGRYYLHAAAVGRDGVWLLCPAESGQGKSTLTVSLLQAGWQYLTDDSVLLWEERDGVEAGRFSTSFHATEDALTRFPRLRAARRLAVWGEKFAYDPTPLFGPPAGERCRPQALVFPEIGLGPTRLEPLSATEAMTRLLRLSVLVFMNRELATPHLQTLRRLATTTAARRVVLGTDAREDPEPVMRLESALWEAGAGR